MILGGGIGAYAEYNYFATDIKYTDNKSVAKALNELYQNKKETSDDVKNITASGTQTLDKYYKNLNVNVTQIPKTLLWTNSYPNSSFEKPTITLSSSLENFTHILLKFKASTTSTIIYDNIFKISPFRLNNRTDGMGQYELSTWASNSSYYIRTFKYVDSNTLIFGGAADTAAPGTNDFTKLIPIEIYGLNFSY